MKITPRFFASIVVLLAIGVARAADSASPITGPQSSTATAATTAPDAYSGPLWVPLDTASVLTAAADITPAKFPNCDYALVDARQVRTYRDDGTGEAQDEEFTKVLTERGRRAKRIITRQFMMPYSTAEVVKLELIRANGAVVSIDVKANARESSDSSMMSANIYDPNMRVLQVNVPGLEVGDVVHLVARQTITRAIIPGHASEENVFEDEGYIRHVSYEIVAPNSKPLRHIVLRDEVPGTITSTREQQGDSIVYRWEVNNVPRMYGEPGMPASVMSLQRLFVTTLPDWKAVSQWYWNLSAAHLDAGSADIQKNVESLVATGATDTEKIKAIFYYVSKNIRYMGITPEKDRPGFEPHDVQLTYAKKYGVCRDKAALLVSMLRAAGFKAFPVLESYGWRKDQEAPDPGFNHAIVAVDQGDGDYLLMDPTDENTLEFLPAAECNWSYLVCRPEGEELKTIPLQPTERNQMTIHTQGELDGAGNLKARAELTFAGINDNAYRAAFAQMKPDDRQRAFETMLKQALPSARLLSLKLTPANLLDRTQVLRAELDFAVAGATAAASGKSVVTLPWLGRHFGVVSFLLRGAGLEKRKYPLQTYVACGVREDVAVNVSSDYTGVVSMPACQPESDATKFYGESVTLENGVLKGARNLELKVAEFSPTEYVALKRTLQTMAYDERKSPILAVVEQPGRSRALASASAPLPVESDIKVLRAEERIDVTDAHTAKVTLHTVTKVLTYSGKKSASEFKMTYNPACEQVKLIGARVTSAEGKVQEISAGEVNMMDAPWNPSAKRYTGGKIMVANLPGVEIGSTLEVTAEITIAGKPFISGFVSFQGENEYVDHGLTLTYPASLPVQWVDRNPAGFLNRTNTTANDRTVLAWNAKDVAALPAEPSQPPGWSFLPGVQYFAGDPAAYWHDVHAAMLQHAEHSSKAGDLARQLAKDGGTAGLTAIRDYVAKGIRLAGPAFTELPLSELSDADTVLSDGYGHVADRAILLYAMLKSAGYAPEIVMVSGIPPIETLRDLATSLPLPHAYDHPLVRVTVSNQPYYLNDTDQYARLGSTNHDGYLALVLPSGRYETVQAAKGCGRETKTSYAIAFAENGTARITIGRQYYGPVYNEKKRFFTELPPEEKRRYFEQAVSSVAQGARPLGTLTTRFDDYPGTEEFSVEIDHFGVVDGKHFYFSMPFTPSLIGVASDQRRLPLFIRQADVRTITADINLPPSYTRYVIAPPSNLWKEPAGAGEAEIVATTQPGHSVVTYRFRTEPAIISPQEYPDVVTIASALGNRSTQLFLVGQGGPAASESLREPASGGAH